MAEVAEEVVFAIAGVELILDGREIGDVSGDSALPMAAVIKRTGDEEIHIIEQTGGLQLVVNGLRIGCAQSLDAPEALRIDRRGRVFAQFAHNSARGQQSQIVGSVAEEGFVVVEIIITRQVPNGWYRGQIENRGAGAAWRAAGAPDGAGVESEVVGGNRREEAAGGHTSRELRSVGRDQPPSDEIVQRRLDISHI